MQSSHSVEPVPPLALPLLQFTHAAIPSLLWNWPTSHGEHVAAAAALDLPASQGVHEAAPEPDDLPATHSMHKSALVFDHVPLSHFVHALLATLE